MRLLPRERRDGMYAVYAFCREVDDIADDEGTPPEQKAAALDAWRSEIEALYEGACRDSLVGRALRHPVLCYSLRREDFHAVIDGMEMDAAEDIRAPDMATLDLYCARVAAAVGHLSVHVFGDPSPDAHAVADSLGRALQLTNILRDLDEDARRGRLYLPRELLDRHGIRTRRTASGAAPSGAARGVPRSRGNSDASFRRGRKRRWRAARGARCGRPLSWALSTARCSTRSFRSEWRDPSRRIGLSKRQKLWLVLRHGIL